MQRKFPLAVGYAYHIFSRSIANFIIFNNSSDYQRMLMLLCYFQIKDPPTKFSYFIRNKNTKNSDFSQIFNPLVKNQPKIVQLIGYCLMPTHIHLIIKQTTNQGISIYLSNVLNSYARYFNTRHKRKGPLWEGRFKNVFIENDEQLLHLTRYIHLNPVTSSLVKKPEDWQFSSYLEYIEDKNTLGFCSYKNAIGITPEEYQKFVEERADYQKELGKIKKLYANMI